MTGMPTSNEPAPHGRGSIRWRLILGVMALLLVVLFSIPCIGGETGIPDGLYQAVCILLIFPLVVLTGAGSATTDPKSTAVCKWP